MKKGDKVIFTEASDEQVRWGGNDDPRLVLEIGKEYEIDEVEEHPWHTKVQIAGVNGRFNSVHFQPAPVAADPDDEKAAEKHATEYITEPTGYGASFMKAGYKDGFLAGCAHKAQELAKYGDMASALSKAGQEIERLRQALHQ